jgi:hypothetical protein
MSLSSRSQPTGKLLFGLLPQIHVWFVAANAAGPGAPRPRKRARVGLQVERGREAPSHIAISE